MTEPSEPEMLWFTRRDGVVRGPFPADWIRRYILLGRIRMTDELRLGAADWQPVFRCGELIPEPLRQPLTEDNLARLREARLAVDERGPGGRRGEAESPGIERRGGAERRQPESAEVLRHRARRARELCRCSSFAPVKARQSLRGLLVLGLLAVLVLLVLR